MTEAGGRTRGRGARGRDGACSAAFELTQPHLARPLRGDRLPAGLAPGRQVRQRTRPGRANRGARTARLVWLLRQRLPHDPALLRGVGPAESYPIRTWDAAFKKCNDVVLFESWRDRWTPWHLHMEPDDEIPRRRPRRVPARLLRGPVRLVAVRVPAAPGEAARSGAAAPPPRARRRQRPGRDAHRDRPTGLEHASVSQLLKPLARATTAYADWPPRARTRPRGASASGSNRC